MTMPNPERQSMLACITLLAAACTHAAEPAPRTAPNADMAYVAASLQRDAGRNQALTGVLSLPMGRRAWAQLGGGRARVTQGPAARRTNAVQAGLGYIGDGWRTSIATGQRDSGDALRQSELSGMVEWRAERGSLGVDLARRHQRASGTVPASAGTAATPVRQRARGMGVGLHGSVSPTSRLALHAAAMSFDNRVTTQHASTGQPQLLGVLAVNPTVVSSEELALSRSSTVAASYRFDTLTLTGEWLNDRALDSASSLGTTRLKAAMDVAPGWRVVPAVGRARNAEARGVNFGELTLLRAW
jgi:hypothetical protein